MKSIVIALSLSVLSLGAVASEATIFDDTVHSTRTRAEVRAEVIAALARGERLSYGEAQVTSPGRVTYTADRAMVLAEAREARLRGELNDGEATQRGRL
jgi:hypothetical protein